MSAVRERMLTTTYNNLKIRMWVGVTLSPQGQWLPSWDACMSQLDVQLFEAEKRLISTPELLAEWLAGNVPHCNAVEVLRPNGSGALVYPDWP
jgi:hypothetical protein